VRDVLNGLLIAAVVTAVYANTLSNEFINDDVPAIVANDAVRSGDMLRIFTTPSWTASASTNHLYRPLITLSFAANYAVGALQPSGYRMVNIALHAIASIVAYVLVVSLGGQMGVALVAALLFAAHPINSEALNAVVGRAEIVAGLCVVLGVLLDVRSYHARSPAVRLALTGATILAFTCGLLSKESTATLIPAAAATDLAIRCKWRWGEFTAGLRGGRGVLYGALALVLLAYLMWRAHIGVQPPMSEGMNPLLGLPIETRLPNAVVIAGRYLRLLVWPIRLSADYMIGAVPIIQSWLDWRVALSAVAIGCVVLIATLAVRGAPLVTWAIVFALATYSLVSNVAFPTWAMMGERWMYLPAVGFSVVLAVGGERLLAGALPQQGARVGALLAAMLIVAYGTRTIVRNRDWHDFMSLWTATIEAVPGSFKAREGLAHGYVQQGRYAEAAQLLEESLRIHDGDPRTYIDLATVYERIGNLENAARYYQAALDRSPGRVDLLIGLGRVSLAQGAYGNAVLAFNDAVKRVPKSATLHAALGQAYYLQNSPSAARAEFDAALKLDPNIPDGLIGLAACQQLDRSYRDAIENYLKALALGAPRTDNLRQTLEQALVALAKSDPRATAGLAVQALRYYPQADAIKQLAALSES